MEFYVLLCSSNSIGLFFVGGFVLCSMYFSSMCFCDALCATIQVWCIVVVESKVFETYGVFVYMYDYKFV